MRQQKAIACVRFQLKGFALKGFKIFTHALRMVFGNFGTVLRILVPPVLIAAAVFVGAMYMSGLSFEELDASAQPAQGPNPIFILTAFLLIVFTFIWVAVAWHRFVLLEERPVGALPKPHMNAMMSYVGKILLLSLIGVVCMIPVAVLLWALVAVTNSPVLGLVPLLMMLVFSVFFLRASVVLPAAAIGRKLTVREAWEATRGSTWPIVLCYFLSMVLGMLLSGLSLGGTLITPFLGVAVQIATQPVLTVINMSVLTTLYGHYVEGRELI
ncbi:hypothetical protein ATO10_06236 [Actibacterium atlanticum]|uniref:Glycerophosphoryl diester phosphodiesterase membrane domain-containing protein n=1 Tax=Actibacterium atlanticum TaxID=1461693 RepID=A0A058ZLS6_9RHOB|nr:hypothetical protein ATO10_06236 [Actibacterium atlanticum]